jgi:hypothetical protein
MTNDGAPASTHRPNARGNTYPARALPRLVYAGLELPECNTVVVGQPLVELYGGCVVVLKVSCCGIISYTPRRWVGAEADAARHLDALERRTEAASSLW